MEATSTPKRVLLILLATALLVTSGTLAFAVAYDYHTRGLVTQGVTVAGADLSGMNEQQARETIEQAVSAPLLRPLTVTGAEGVSWTLAPQGIVSVDIEAMLDAAYAPRRGASIVERLSSQVASVPLPATIEPVYSIDTSAIAQWVASTAQQVDRDPVDAKRKIVKYKFKIKPDVDGARVDQAAAVAEIAQALSADVALSSQLRTVSLPTESISAKVTKKDLTKPAIIVSLSECRIRLYKGEKLVKSYRCAPGTRVFPTPTGDFKVVRKLAYAPWINPGSAWAKNMPKSIPPGPGNPMGVHKIGINMPGIFMHGIPPSEFSTIGRPASHGCMRMMPSDAADLFKRVKVGTPVYIRR